MSLGRLGADTIPSSSAETPTSHEVPGSPAHSRVDSRPPNRLFNFFAFTATSALQPALKLVFLPVFAALLGPDGMGRVAYIEAILLFIAVLSILGIHYYFLRNYHHVDREILFSTLTRFLLLYNLVILALCLAGSLLFDDPVEQVCFALASVTNFLAVVLILPLRELRLQERAFLYGATYAGMGIAQTLLALLLVWMGLGVVGWFLGYLLALAPIALYYTIRTIPRLRPAPQPKMLGEALWLGGALTASALGMMSVSIADRIQLKILASYDQVGLYSVGYGLGIGVSVVCSALYTTFEPTLYKHTLMDEAFSRSFARSFAISYIVVTSIAAMVIVLIEPLGHLLLEARFGPALPITKIVAACGIYGLCHLYFTLVGVRFQSKRALVLATFAGAGLNIVANHVLIPAWGIIGAAYSTFGAYLAMMLFYSLVMWRLPALRTLYIAALLVPIGILGTVVAADASTGWFVTLAPIIAALLGMAWVARVGGLVPWKPHSSPQQA